MVIAAGKRPVPFRTRKLSLPAPMVLHPPGCGRVGHRRTPTQPHPSGCQKKRGVGSSAESRPPLFFHAPFFFLRGLRPPFFFSFYAHSTSAQCCTSARLLCPRISADRCPGEGLCLYRLAVGIGGPEKQFVTAGSGPAGRPHRKQGRWTRGRELVRSTAVEEGTVGGLVAVRGVRGDKKGWATGSCATAAVDTGWGRVPGEKLGGPDATGARS